MYYLSDTRDLVNNNDYATYMFNFNFVINNFCTIYMLAILCMCVLKLLLLLTIEHMPV